MDTARRDPFASMGYEIFKAHIRSDALEIGVHRLGELTFIKCAAALLAQQLQRIGKIWIAEDVTHLWGGAVGEPNGGRVIELFDQRLLLLKGGEVAPEVVGNHRRNRKPLPGVAHRRRQHVGHRQFTEALMGGEPSIDRSRNGHRQ